MGLDILPAFPTKDHGVREVTIRGTCPYDKKGHLLTKFAFLCTIAYGALSGLENVQIHKKGR
jgi:hypothetical protein